MADEPERRIMGALLVELERQAEETNYLYVGAPDEGGCVIIDGELDVHALAMAVLEETK